jgi:hypothetical protein
MATGYRLEWWLLSRAAFFSRMTQRDRTDWERIASCVEVRANETIPTPRRELVYAVEQGRARLAVPKRGDAARRNPKAKPGDDEKRVYHIVQLAEDGDLFGWRPLRATTDLSVDSASVDTLRPTRLWTVPRGLFAQYLQGRASWRMPAPLTKRGHPAYDAVATTISAFRSRDGVPLQFLWDRCANARIATALLYALESGWTLERNVQRLRTRFTVETLARRAGVDSEWARRWVSYARHEGVLTHRLGIWKIRRLWQLSRWAESSVSDFALDPPPDPVEQIEDGDVSLGRASRDADGTTPETADTTDVQV